MGRIKLNPAILLLTGCVSVVLAPLRVQAGQPNNNAREIALQTAYLDHPLAGARHVAVTGTVGGPDGGAGEITLDPNTCRLDEYGDRMGCTRRAVRRVPARFQLLKPADPARGRPLLYRIAAEGLPEELFLVVPVRDGGAYRLIARDRNATSRVVTLEKQTAKETEMAPRPAEPAGEGRPGKATYHAQQVPGAVIITAEGDYPSAGYESFFRQSAIAVFPPEFSFVWAPPDGPAAQVITPFRTSTYFKAVEPVESVTIHDAEGRHTVEVTQVPEPRSGIQ